MMNINITNFRKDIYSLFQQTIRHNQPIHIATKDGNAVLISEEEYNGLMETIYLCSIPGMKEHLNQARNAPDSEYVSEDEAQW